MKKLFRLLGSLPLVFVFFLSFANYSFAQEGIVSATVRPNPLEVKISAPAVVNVGQWFDINVDVTNFGTETINDVVVVINNPQGLSVKGKKSIALGNLLPGETKPFSWEAKVSQPLDYIVQVEATGLLSGEVVTNSDTVVILTSGSLGAFLLKLIFG